MPNQSDPNQTSSPPPVVPSGQSDLPPLPDFMSANNPAPAPTGSAAPSDLPSAMGPTTPKKKYGTGRIIATILGLLLLVGGVGAGLLLTQQQQLFQQKAGGNCNADYQCGSGQCISGVCVNQCTSNNNCKAGTECKGGECVAKTTGGTTPNLVSCTTDSQCGVGETCQSGLCKTGTTTTTTTTTTGTCQTSADCGVGKQCVNSNCVSTTCTTNLDCPSGQNCTSGTCTGTTTNVGAVDCGGASAGQACTTGADCHCQGGDACTSKICEPDIHTSCLNQGRAWCTNVSGSGKTCCVAGYVCNTNGPGCVPGATNPPNNPTASCQNIKAYSSSFAAISASDFSKLTAGTQVNFCVVGSATNGSFDKAMFTINGTQEAETTVQRPGSQDFCQSYTILATDTKVDVSAIIHHVTLGWK